MKKNDLVWLDGKLVSHAQVPLLSHALHYGTGVFEGIRVYDTAEGPMTFRLHEHVERLFHSAAAIGIAIAYSKTMIEQAVGRMVTANRLRSCYVRPIVFYGEGQMGLFPRGAKIHVAIAAWPWPAYLGEHPSISACLSPYIRFHPKSIAPGAKISGLYAVSTIATMEARKRGFDECIMLDYDGNVAEGPGENIFIVKKGKLLTPNSESILRGITRDSVMTMARDFGISVTEKKISVRELLSADEAFFSGTAVEIAAIGKIDGRRIGAGRGAGKLGPITQKIREAYFSAVRGKLAAYRKWLTPTRI